jgi:hypothetical protein
MGATPMNPFDEIANQEGLGTVRLLRHIAGLWLQVKALQREADELKARLDTLRPHEVP